MAKPVSLPTRNFTTQSAALEYFKNILYAYDIGEVVSDPMHDRMLRELCDRHPDAVEKTGVGIEEFFVNKTDSGDFGFVSANARGIWIRRTDGSIVDWSYQTAIRRPGPRANFKDALRLAVNDERVSIRDAAFESGPVKCALTGVSIHTKSEADVVYRDPTWSELVEGFVATQGGWGKVETNSGFGEIAVGGRVADPVLDKWMEYWKANAHPVLVSKDEGGRGARP